MKVRVRGSRIALGPAQRRHFAEAAVQRARAEAAAVRVRKFLAQRHRARTRKGRWVAGAAAIAAVVAATGYAWRRKP